MTAHLLFLLAAVTLILIGAPMPLTATKRFMNITSVVFTPAGGSAVPLSGVTSAKRATSPKDVRAAGDGDVIDTFAGVNELDPQVVLEMNKSALLDTVTDGTIGTLVFTVNDARNGAVTAGGAIIYTLINAYLMTGEQDNKHRTISTIQATFKSFSTDGTTIPLSSAAA